MEMIIRWHDAEQEMPAKDGMYLVTVERDKECCIDIYEYGEFFDRDVDKSYGFFVYRELPDGEWYDLSPKTLREKIIAWTELPAPYKKEDK